MKGHKVDPNWRFAERWRRAHYFDGRDPGKSISLCGAHPLTERNYPVLDPDHNGCKACWEKLLDRIGTRPEASATT